MMTAIDANTSLCSQCTVIPVSFHLKVLGVMRQLLCGSFLNEELALFGANCCKIGTEAKTTPS